MMIEFQDGSLANQLSQVVEYNIAVINNPSPYPSLKSSSCEGCFRKIQLQT